MTDSIVRRRHRKEGIPQRAESEGGAVSRQRSRSELLGTEGELEETWILQREHSPQKAHQHSKLHSSLQHDNVSTGYKGDKPKMKKIASAVAMALMLSMTVPTFAAIDLSGKVETRMELGRNAETNEWEVTGKTGVDVQTGFKAEGGQQVKAVVQLEGLRMNSFDDKGNPDQDFNGEYPEVNNNLLNIKKVWLETEGPFWHGGPSMSTRVGDVNIQWNGLVGHLEDVRGITIEGMEVGPVTGRAFYAFDKDTPHQPMGLQANANIHGIDLGAMVMHRGDVGTELAANIGTEIAPGIGVEGEAALDGEQNYLYRVGATVETMPNLVLTAGYRGYNDFAPAYAKYDEDRSKSAYDKETGFTVGVQTEQNGVELAAEYDQPTATMTAKAETEIFETDVWASTKLVEQKMEETKFGAKRTFPVAGLDITGQYEGTLAADKDAKHVLKANTKLNMIPELQGLGLNAEVELQGTKLGHWAAGAEFQAPNGISLGAGYHSVDGPSVTAGLKASF